MVFVKQINAMHFLIKRNVVVIKGFEIDGRARAEAANEARDQMELDFYYRPCYPKRGYAEKKPAKQNT